MLLYVWTTHRASSYHNYSVMVQYNNFYRPIGDIDINILSQKRGVYAKLNVISYKMPGCKEPLAIPCFQSYLHAAPAQLRSIAEYSHCNH